jgi:hypothetical protein
MENKSNRLLTQEEKDQAMELGKKLVYVVMPRLIELMVKGAALDEAEKEELKNLKYTLNQELIMIEKSKELMGQQLLKDSEDIYFHVKFKAEQGDEDAMKAYEKLRASYIAMKKDDLEGREN